MRILSWLFGRPPSKATTAKLAPSGNYDFEIVGESHYQDALSAICGGKCEDGHKHECIAVLIPEPSNPHDGNAIRVFVDRRRVGYLSRKHAAFVAHEMRLSRPPLGSLYCGAMIVGGWDRGSGDEGHFGVKLNMEWPIRILAPGS